MSKKDIIEYMNRYLEKYIGKYRVLAYYDILTGDFPRDENGCIDESFDDLYIPCKKGVIKHTYDDFDKLALCIYDKRQSVAESIYDEIISKYPDIDITLELDGSDNYIYFYDKDISKVASIVKPKTSGAKIKWNSSKNLPKIAHVIPKEDLNKLTSVINCLDRVAKMHFMKSVNSEFINKFNLKDDLDKSRLSIKEYIHSIGKWEDYIKFIKKKIKEVY